MSVTALAEYLIRPPEQQETILHNSRFAQQSIVAANQDALRALRAYNADPNRDKSSLHMVNEALLRKSKTADRPKARDEAKRCSEIIQQFILSENALGLRGWPLETPPRFNAINIEGVEVSVQPDFLVRGSRDRIGAGFLRVAKSPDAESAQKDDTKDRRRERRREMARYMVAIAQMLIQQQTIVPGEVDRELCFVADVRLGELIRAGADHTARLRAVEGACRQIVALWPTISPRPSILR